MINEYKINCPIDRFEYLVDFEARRCERESRRSKNKEADFLETIIERESGIASFVDSEVQERDLI